MNIGGSKIKFLVTGASGFIGHEVAHQLAMAGYRPRLMIAHPRDDCEICHLDADFVLADLTKPETLKDAVKGVDGIIHLACRGKNVYTHLHVADASAAIIAAVEQAYRRPYLSATACHRHGLLFSTQPGSTSPRLKPLLCLSGLPIWPLFS